MVDKKIKNGHRQIFKDLNHMKGHLEAAKINIDLVENYLIAAIEREKKAIRKSEKTDG